MAPATRHYLQASRHYPPELAYMIASYAETGYTCIFLMNFDRETSFEAIGTITNVTSEEHAVRKILENKHNFEIFLQSLHDKREILLYGLDYDTIFADKRGVWRYDDLDYKTQEKIYSHMKQRFYSRPQDLIKIWKNMWRDPSVSVNYILTDEDSLVYTGLLESKMIVRQLYYRRNVI